MARRTIAQQRTQRHARLEDLTFMADTGETPEGAARRLGVRADSLDKWCDRNAPALWDRLQANTRRQHLRTGTTRRTA